MRTPGVRVASSSSRYKLQILWAQTVRQSKQAQFTKIKKATEMLVPVSTSCKNTPKQARPYKKGNKGKQKRQ